MTIVEIARLKAASALFNVDSFVYQLYPIPDGVEWAEFWTDTFGVEQTLNTRKMFVAEVVEDPATNYSRVTSYAICVATESSWYWDKDNQSLTVHMDHEAAPYTETFRYGETQGYTNSDVVYIEDLEYPPYLISVPSIAQRQDIINYEKLAMINGRIELGNVEERPETEAPLDFLITENIYGNTVQLYYLPDHPQPYDYQRADLVPLAAFYVEDYSFTAKSISLNVKDRREYRNVTVPTDLFTVADYPDLEEELDNTVIPIMFGEVRESTAICTNGTTTSGDVEFRQALSLTTLGTVYVKKEETWTAVTPTATSVSTGEFTLSAADGRDSSGTPLECKVVGSVGEVITYASDIIKSLYLTYAGIAFNDAYYDTAEWAVEETALQPVGLLIDEEMQITDVILMIQNGSNVGFRFEINAEGQRTIRVDDEARTSSGRIANVEILDRDVLPVSTDIKTLAATYRVQYAKSYNSGNYLSVLDDTQAATVAGEYRQKPYKEIETLLVDSSGVAERLAYEKARFSTVRGIFSGAIAGRDYLDLRIYDILDIEITPSQFVSGSTISGRQYFGVKKCKVISVDPKLSGAPVNKISAVIIGDA